MNGEVFLVGAGPGDAGLITVKGLDLIKQADVIVYDRLANPQILSFARDDVEKIYVGKQPDRHTLTQEEINELLAEKAKQNKKVVRLKGGDPFIFGRGGEEAEHLLNEGISYEVVPGITSAIAVPAYAGIPVTHRDFNSSFAIVTGHEHPEKRDTSLNWGKLATATETLIFLMGVKNLPYISEQLQKYGRKSTTPIALIRWGTRIEQEVLTGTLGDIVDKVQQAKFGSPAIIVVGEVVNLREKLAWFEQKPLFGQRILVTRSRSQNSQLSTKITALGGESLEFPVIKTSMTDHKQKQAEVLSQISTYDWLIFTSVNGVKYFFKHLQKERVDIRRFAQAKIVAVGPKTAALLQEKGLIVDHQPTEYHAEALLDTLQPYVKAGQKILLPRADIARKAWLDTWRQMGCQVVEWDVYETKMEAENAKQVVEMLQAGDIHAITFTSSSTVHNLVEALTPFHTDISSLLNQVKIACIGPITAQAAEKAGLQVNAVADQYTIDGLVASLQTLSRT